MKFADKVIVRGVCGVQKSSIRLQNPRRAQWNSNPSESYVHRPPTSQRSRRPAKGPGCIADIYHRQRLSAGDSMSEAVPGVSRNSVIVPGDRGQRAEAFDSFSPLLKSCEGSAAFGDPSPAIRRSARALSASQRSIHQYAYHKRAVCFVRRPNSRMVMRPPFSKETTSFLRRRP